MQRHGLTEDDISRLGVCQEERRRVFGEMLKGDQPFFDIVVLLASDEAQTKGFEAEIAERMAAGQLPRAEYRVFADGDFKIGNGGAMMQSLSALEAEFGAAALDAKKILMLPAGGYSTRLPQWGPRGKIFAPVVYAGIDTGSAGETAPATMLEMKLMNYVDLLPRLPAGSVFFAWSDMLVFFDPEGLEFDKPGITVCSYPGSVPYGSNHAVLALAPGTYQPSGSFTCECTAYLEKASEEKMRSVGAVFDSPLGEVVIVDADLNFDAPTCRMLAAFWRDNNLAENLREELDSSSDMLEQLGSGAPPSPLLSSGDTTSVIAKMHVAMRAAATQINAAVLQPASVLHIGTCTEYLAGYCAGIEELGGLTRYFNKLTCDVSTEACIVHSVVDGVSSLGALAMVEYSTLKSVTVGAGSLVAFCDVVDAEIPAGTFLSTCPVTEEGAESFCCSVMSLTDDIKAKPGTATFCGVLVEEVLAALKLSNEQVWKEGEKNTLFYARLFPVAATAQAAASTAIALRAFLLDLTAGTASAPPALGQLMSMAEIFKFKSPARDRAIRLQLVDEISAFLKASSK